ncbi:MAG: TolC family protein, partial [Candidatus Hydrogenedentota bacterium]
HIDQTSPPSPLQAVFGGLTGTVETRVTNYQLQFGGLLPRWGTQYNTSYQVGRESGTFSAVATYDGQLTSTITQPVLRGRGTAVNRIQIDTAANGQNIAKYEIQRTALVTIGETIKAYWDLVGAIKNLEVRQQSLDNAMRLVGINEKRLEIGTAAAIEVLQAKAQAATRHSDLITARTSILDTEDVLKNFINLNDNDVFSTTSIIPTTSPGMVGHQWDLDQSITTALNNRPEIRTAELQIENARLSKKGTKNDLLPSLDASVSYGQAARELTAGELRNGIREKQGRTWNFGLQGSIPIGNRAAKGAHMRSEQFERQQELRLTKAQRDVMLDVRMGIRGVVTTEILVESDKQARILQEANVAAEEKRLNLGVTTSQDVLDRQEDLTLAQTQELQSVVNYEKALIQLQVAEGTLLKNLDINWEVEE